MNTTRPGLLVISGVGICLAGYSGYLCGYTSTDNWAASASDSLSAPADIAPQQPPEPEKQRERPTTWHPVPPDFVASLLNPDPLPLLSSAPSTLSSATLPLDALLSPSPRPDPLADYIYTGTVTVDGIRSALIEHRTNKQGWYVQAGERWQEYRIVEVTDQAVSVLVQGKTYLLPKSDVINLVPFLTDTSKGGLSSSANALPQLALAEVQQLSLGPGDEMNLYDNNISLNNSIEQVNDSMTLFLNQIQAHMSAQDGVLFFNPQGPEAGWFNSVTVTLNNEISNVLPLSPGVSGGETSGETRPAVPMRDEPIRQPSEPLERAEPNAPPSGELEILQLAAESR